MTLTIHEHEKSVCIKCNQARDVLFLDLVQSSEVPFRIGIYGAYSRVLPKI